ncbi:MAG: GNAT family N-acetyltransferase [Eubacteriales bacterium]|jgi:ribosomal protein S18 acetylase RimI-like enzyme|nr:GNAT family N-acetyltransferase [Eubacteriales bacterium]
MIRPIKTSEIMLLTDFLYESIFQPDTENKLPRTIIQEPSIWIYIDGFGSKKDDHCFVAEIDGRIVGAVWVRCIRAFGHIDDSVPEFAMAVYPEHRRKGIGNKLMRRMLAHLKNRGYSRTSLSVQKNNYALKMYSKVGFKIIGENEHDYIMACDLDSIEL